MARAATTSDVCNAIAERQRREILTLLRTDGFDRLDAYVQDLSRTDRGRS